MSGSDMTVRYRYINNQTIIRVRITSFVSKSFASTYGIHGNSNETIPYYTN